MERSCVLIPLPPIVSIEEISYSRAVASRCLYTVESKKEISGTYVQRSLSSEWRPWEGIKQARMAAEAWRRI
jgi:hypothetical protein